MQIANNTNNYTVEGLVAKYRNFVAEKTPKVREFDGVDFFEAPASIVDSNSDQQLIVSIYRAVAGNKADKDVLAALSDYEQHFHKDALNLDEFSFLCENFSDVIAYEFNNMQDWGGEHVISRYWFSNNHEKIKGLIGERIKIEEGMTVFIPNSGYGDIASLFNGCTVKGYSTKFYDPNNERDKYWEKNTNEIWALGQIRLLASGIQSEITPWYNQESIESYKESVDLIVCDSSHFVHWECNELYPLLKDGGQMFVFAKRDDLVEYTKHERYQFKKMAKLVKDSKSKTDLERKKFFDTIIKDRAIKSLVAYQDNNITLGLPEDCVLIEVDKNQHSTFYAESINRGEIAEVDIAELKSDMLWPGYYIVKRPQNGKPLSSLVRVFNTKDENVKQYWDRKAKKVTLSGDIKVLMPKEASVNFAGACLSNKDLRSVSDPMFDGWESKFICPNQPGVCLYGSSEGMVLWYVDEDPTDKYVCVDIIPYLIPKKGVDHRYVAALLLSPEVRQQIESICDGTITTYTMSLILDKIIVPNHTPKERLQFLAVASYSSMLSTRDKMEKEFDEKFNKMKTDYMNEVRMRKHDIRPHLRQLASSQRLMLHYLDNIFNVDELKNVLKRQIETSKNALDNISDLVNHFADEERFGEPERVIIDKFIEDYVAVHNDDYFILEFNCKDAKKQMGEESIHMLKELAEKRNTTLEQFVEWLDNSDLDTIRKQLDNNVNFLNLKDKLAEKNVTFEQFVKSASLYVYIAPVDLKRLITNIIDNARHHGFYGKDKSDCIISINVRVDNQRNNYIIDFSNNGCPLPIGMTKERYGLKGEKAGINGGTGNGGYIVKSIVEHYGGDYDIFSKDNLTTIRIYLPIYSI